MHHGTMKRDNTFPMAINYRINSGARGGGDAYAKLPFLRNQLFCFVAKAIAFRSNRIFFRDWRRRAGRAKGRGMRILLLMINFFFRSRHACETMAHARVFVVRIKFDKSRRVARSAGLLKRYFIERNNPECDCRIVQESRVAY